MSSVTSRLEPFQPMSHHHHMMPVTAGLPTGTIIGHVATHPAFQILPNQELNAYPPGGFQIQWVLPSAAPVQPVHYAPEASTYLPLYQQDWYLILHRLKQQVEFYFSFENLVRDDFLVQHMVANQGSVPCHVVGSFPRVLNIVGGHPASSHLLARALSTSNVVRVYGHYLCPLNNILQIVLLARAPQEEPTAVVQTNTACDEPSESQAERDKCNESSDVTLGETSEASPTIDKREEKNSNHILPGNVNESECWSENKDMNSSQSKKRTLEQNAPENTSQGRHHNTVEHASASSSTDETKAEESKNNAEKNDKSNFTSKKETSISITNCIEQVRNRNNSKERRNTLSKGRHHTKNRRQQRASKQDHSSFENNAPRKSNGAGVLKGMQNLRLDSNMK